jgi:endonuclease YncB( thermonuclease family)
VTGYPGFQWVLPAQIVEWHDGDTAYCDVWLPRGPVQPRWPVRLLRLYCPELDGADGRPEPGALEAFNYASRLAPAGTLVRLVPKPLGRNGVWSSSTQESLARLLAAMQLPDLTDFSDRMVNAGMGFHTHVPGSGEGIHGID